MTGSIVRVEFAGLSEQPLTAPSSGASRARMIKPSSLQARRGFDSGLLLRSDIHTLFDLQRLTVLPSLKVRLHPQLLGGDYAPFDGKRLAVVPEDSTATPAAQVLLEHNGRCRWLDRLDVSQQPTQHGSGSGNER